MTRRPHRVVRSGRDLEPATANSADGSAEYYLGYSSTTTRRAARHPRGNARQSNGVSARAAAISSALIGAANSCSWSVVMITCRVRSLAWPWA